MKSFKKVGVLALTMALSVSALATSTAYAADSSYVYSKQTSAYSSNLVRYVSSSEVNVRSAKSLDNNNLLGSIKAGQVIEGVKDGAWIRFTFAGRTAYTSANFYRTTSQAVHPEYSINSQNYKATGQINVRSGKSTSYSVLGVVSRDTVIRGVVEGNWIRFIFNGKTAYTAAVLYDETSLPVGYQASSSSQNYKATDQINVRSGKGTSYSKLGVVPSGTIIEGILEDYWIRFTYDGKTAYTAASLYNKTSQAAHPEYSIDTRNYKATAYVNVRSGKGTNYSKLGTIPTSTVIKGVKDGDWIRFIYKGKISYTAATYYNKTSQAVTKLDAAPSIPVTSASSKAGKAAAIARSKVGLAYSFGAAGPYAFDCSGLTMYSYANVGISLPRGAQAQSRLGTTVSYDNMLPGDLIFFGSYADTYHVAMYVGNGKIVHASTPSTGVIMDSVDNIWIRNNYYTVKRIAK
ncbi:MAG: NlpC/P60 family protein [Tissierellia bacterium]|nr:NlpC/P60 family protein [Tissierellia bacterium]